jgi:phosphatidylglycerophosphate synthase
MTGLVTAAVVLFGVLLVKVLFFAVTLPFRIAFAVLFFPFWIAKTVLKLAMGVVMVPLLLVVGLVLAYVVSVSAIEYYGVSPSPLAGFDAVLYTNWMMWVTAVVTVWTGIDYIIKYYAMVRSVLR